MNQFLILADTAASDAASLGVTSTLVYFAVVILIMWFFIIRPQKKREKEIIDMQNSVKVGDTVLTTGGIYGKVVDTVNDLCIVEFGLNKGVRVPLQKNYIAAIKEPYMTAKKEETEDKIKESKIKEDTDIKDKVKKFKTKRNKAKKDENEIKDEIKYNQAE